MENNEVKKVSPTDADIRQWVSNDLATAITLLNMIRNDPEFLKGVQDMVINRTRAREENEKLQPELDLN